MRRVEIARALLHSPRMLLLDEPTAGLDIKARAGILEVVRGLVADQGIGVLWATHLVDEIRDDDHVIVLHQGRVLADGPVPVYHQRGGRALDRRSMHVVDRRRRGRRRTVNEAVLASERPFGWTQRLICLYGIVWRESLRFLHQRERFISALVRPMVWLFIFAAGFRQTLGIEIMPPYDTYVLYEVYITPGLIAMIQLFNGMQSSLSMVYDREMGSMRMLLVSPAPRWFLLISKLIAGAVQFCRSTPFLSSLISGRSSRRPGGAI